MTRKNKPQIKKSTTPLFENYFIYIFIITLALFILYFPSLTSEFTNYDDDVNITSNTYYPLSFKNLWTIWTEPYLGLYIPLTYTLWGIIFAIGQFLYFISSNPDVFPFIFHLTNILIHGANAFLVFIIIREFLPKNTTNEISYAPLFGSLFFLLHPLQVEAVSWVTGFKDVFSSFLSFMAFYFYLKFLKSNSFNLKSKEYILSCFLFFLAILCKSTSITLLAVFFLSGIIIYNQTIISSLKNLIFPSLLSLGPVLFTQMSQGDTSKIHILFYEKILVLFHALGFYTTKLFLPLGLIPSYGLNPTNVLKNKDYIPYGLLFLFFSISVVLILYRLKFLNRSPLILGLLIALSALSPYLGIIPYKGQLLTTVADRYFYFSMFGMALCLSYLFFSLPLKYKKNSAYFFLLLLPFVPLSFLQSSYWKNTESLFNHTLSVDEKNTQALANLAIHYDKIQDYQKSTYFYKKMLEINPQDEMSLNRLKEIEVNKIIMNANELAQRGRLDEASQIFHEILAKDPKNYSALINLGNIAAIQKDMVLAISYFKKASEINPQEVPAFLSLGRAYQIMGDKKESLEALKKAFELNPYDEKLKIMISQLEN